MYNMKLYVNIMFTKNVSIHYNTMITNYCSYRKNSKYWDTQTSYRSCP